jgi:thioredoxin
LRKAIVEKTAIFLARWQFMAVKKEFSSFQELLETTNIPVLVDFYATWCGPCQMMAPILEQTGMYFKNRLQIVKIDTDKYPNLASKYGIQALPTLVVFKNGQPIDRIEGVMQVNQLVQHLQTLL